MSLVELLIEYQFGLFGFAAIVILLALFLLRK